MGYDETFRKQLIEIAPHLRAFARSLTGGNRDLADDLAQDALAKAIASASSFSPGTNFRAWMFTILRNLYYSEYRKRSRRRETDDSALERLTAPAPQDAHLELDDLKLALSELRPEYREALILVGAGGFSYEEAAAIVDCAVGTIKSRVSRARAELERRFATDDEPPPPNARGRRARETKSKCAEKTPDRQTSKRAAAQTLDALLAPHLLTHR